MSWLGDIDCRAQAEHAMKMAVATAGLERVRWVRIAQAWHELELARARLAARYEPMIEAAN
jgi:hypothetical protein